MGQPSMICSVTNCEKRTIGTNGGFGYKSINEAYDIALMDSMILAQWVCGQKTRSLPNGSEAATNADKRVSIYLPIPPG